MEKHKIPLKEFFKNRKRFNFNLSPDGKKIAFLDTYEKRTNIFLKDVQTGQEEVLTTQQIRNIGNYYWKNSDTIIYLQDNNGDENHSIFVVDLKTKNTTNITPQKEVKNYFMNSLNVQHLLLKEKKFENHILICDNNRNKGLFDLKLLNIHNREQEVLFEPSPGFNGFDLVMDNKLTIRYVNETIPGGENIYIVEKNKQTKLKFVKSTDKYLILDFNNDFSKLYVLSNEKTDKLSLYLVSLDLKEEKLIYSHPEVDINTVNIHPITKNLESVEFTEEKTNFYFFDKKIEKTYNQIKELIISQYPEEKRAEIFIYQDRFNLHLYKIVTSADNKLPRTFLYDLELNELSMLSQDDPYINHKNLVTTEYVSYKARDGLTIHGYLTLPKIENKKKVPMIIIPHGGPWHRDTFGYDSEAQFFASRGFGSFQPNFRISTGYGKNHFVKGWKEWGKACQDDITDGTHFLIEKGITSEGQIGIYGGSYGGYATLMGIIREPKLYSAAVDYVGIADLFTFWDGFPPYWKVKGNIFEEALGNPYENKEYAKEVSPVYQVHKIQTPLMVVQGANDPRVPQKQADQIVEALEKRNVAVEYILKEDEGHGFANEENRLELYDRMIKFFNKHLNK